MKKFDIGFLMKSGKKLTIEKCEGLSAPELYESIVARSVYMSGNENKGLLVSVRIEDVSAIIIKEVRK